VTVHERRDTLAEMGGKIGNVGQIRLGKAEAGTRVDRGGDRVLGRRFHGAGVR